MCGIAGYASFTQRSSEQETIKLMSQVLQHRGPDDESFYQDDFLSLAFRRLSIVDVEGGQQPIWNEDGSIFIVVNGEIYNHKQLRQKLKQEHTFKTKSDSEIVLHLYEEYGVKAFEYLNGMFALAIWDTRSQTLLLARDRLGIKPLYYANVNGTLMFASELKSLLMHPDCPREIDWQDLDVKDLQQKPNVSTYVKKIHHLPAASFVKFSLQDGLTLDSYWSLDSVFGSAKSKTPAELLKEYESLISDSVHKRLMSDVPLGIFLSGGIDSSLITAIAAKQHSNLHCFTVVERTTYRAGDVQQAKKITEQLGVPFYPIYFDSQQLAESFTLSRLEEMIYLIESPRFDPEWLFKSELHKAAKHYVPELKVILLGQGADEFAGGYSTFLGSPNSSWQDYLNTDVKSSINVNDHSGRKIPPRFNGLIPAGDEDSIITDEKSSAGYHKKMALLLNQLQFFNLWHEDRTSSYHSIESRVPFLDHRVVELLASVPERFHEELFWDKKIVRNALHNSLPDYPEDKKKVPFFVTDDIASINEFAWTIAKNVFPDFRDKYLLSSQESQLGSYDQLFDNIVKRRHNMFDSAWQLIELMSVSIFIRYISNAEEFIKEFKKDSDAPLPLVLDDDWAELDTTFNQPPVNPNIISCSVSDVISIPGHCEILNPLTEAEGSTCLVLSFHGEEIRRINVVDDYYWVVQVLDEMGRHTHEPKSVDYWISRAKVSEQQFLPLVENLIMGGFLENLGQNNEDYSRID